MADDNKRQPVPAGGAPIPSAIENAEQTPPASDAGTDNDKSDTLDEDHDGELVEARVLLAFGQYEVNDIVAGSPERIEALKLSGHADPHADAVAHAKSL